MNWRRARHPQIVEERGWNVCVADVHDVADTILHALQASCLWLVVSPTCRVSMAATT